MKYYSGQQQKNEKEIWLCEVCSTIVFYSNYLKKNEREKQQINMIIITVVKEQTKMTTGSLHTKREVINEDMKKLKT